MPDPRIATVDITRVSGQSVRRDDDVLAIEEPLEIRVAWDSEGEPREKSITVTMRTPGDDEDLASGFLFTEGLIGTATDIDSIRHWGSPNVVRIAMRSGIHIDPGRLLRHFYMSSSCGVCGKTSIDALRVAASPLPPRMEPFRGEIIHRLPRELEQQQAAFRSTGGIHGAAVFDAAGRLLRSREDIGRHNAVDKVIGALFREGSTPLRNCILLISSRASFEVVQKAIVAGVPTVAAVGAPSSLAVDLAREFGLTLLGFVRDGRFNVYAGEVQ